MTAVELARMVKAMRKAQAGYFKARSKGLPGAWELDSAKQQEKYVDAAVAAILGDKGPGLFDEKIKEGP